MEADNGGLEDELLEQMGRVEASSDLTDWEDGGSSWGMAWGMVKISHAGAVESDPAFKNVWQSTTFKAEAGGYLTLRLAYPGLQSKFYYDTDPMSESR